MLLRLDELEKRLNDRESGESDEPASLQVGSEAPAFELPDLVGETQTLAQYRGQPLEMGARIVSASARSRPASSNAMV